MWDATEFFDANATAAFDIEAVEQLCPRTFNEPSKHSIVAVFHTVSTYTTASTPHPSLSLNVVGAAVLVANDLD